MLRFLTRHQHNINCSQENITPLHCLALLTSLKRLRISCPKDSIVPVTSLHEVLQCLVPWRFPIPFQWFVCSLLSANSLLKNFFGSSRGPLLLGGSGQWPTSPVIKTALLVFIASSGVGGGGKRGIAEGEKAKSR